ncbi:MAG: hypothetical protein WCK39_09435 [Methanomassiliicoccales archaeon]
MMAPDFAAHAARVKVHYARMMEPQAIQEQVSNMMSAIGLDLVAAGTRLIGHVKCVVEVEKDSYFACSVVGHDGNARCSGSVPHASRELDVIINALQYGLDKKQVAMIVEARARSGFGDARVSVEDLDKGHDDDRPQLVRIK